MRLSSSAALLLSASLALAARVDWARADDAPAAARRAWTIEFDTAFALSGLFTREDDGLAHHRRLYDGLRKRNVNFEVRQEFSVQNVFVGASITLDSDADLESISALPGIKQIYPVRTLSAPAFPQPADDLLPSSSLFTTPSSNLTTFFNRTLNLLTSPHAQTSIDRLHAQGLDGTGIKIAIVDTGVDWTHPALGGCFGLNCKVTFGADLVGDAYNDTLQGPAIPSPLYPVTCNPHGTFVAGVAAARDPHSQLVGAAPGASLGVYRVFGCAGSAGDDVVAMGIVKAYQDGADVINLSLGGPDGWTTSLADVVASRIRALGKVVATAAGNYGQEGMFYANSPAGGIGVDAVGSVNSLFTSGYSSFTVSTGYGPITYYTYAAWPDVNATLPLFFTDPSGTSTTDACNPLPESTPALGGYAVVIRRGGCLIAQKINNAKAKGADVVLIVDTANDLGPITDVAGIHAAMISGADGAYLLANPNATVTFVYAPSTTPDPQGGLLASFSSYGPTADAYGKPSFAAPGTNIPSTYPVSLGSYYIANGTSVSTPIWSGAVALYLQANGKNTPPATVSAAFAGTAKPVPASADGDALSSVAGQGTGLIDAYAAVHTQTIVSPSQLNLNDTANFKGTQIITIRNNGNRAKWYTLSHVPALTANFLTPGYLQPNPNPVPTTSAAATVRFLTTRVLVLPKVSLPVVVNFSAPEDVDARAYPVYSGFIVIDDGQGETVRVAYNGIAAKLGDLQVLDNTDDYFLQGFPVPFTYKQANRALQFSNPVTYTLANRDAPAIVYRLSAPSPYVRIDLIDTAQNFTPTYPIQAPAWFNAKRSPAALDAHRQRLEKRLRLDLDLNLGAGSSRGEDKDNVVSSLVGNVTGLLFKWLGGGNGKNTFAQTPVVGVLDEDLGVSRSGFVNNAEGFGYNRFLFSGNFLNGTAVPNGTYKILIRALKITGDPADADDYESWLSGPMTFARP